MMSETVLETREQYVKRMDGVKGDLERYISGESGLTEGDKKALENLAAKYGFTLNTATNQSPADQFSNARPKGAEESKESDKSGK